MEVEVEGSEMRQGKISKPLSAFWRDFGLDFGLEDAICRPLQVGAGGAGLGLLASGAS